MTPSAAEIRAALLDLAGRRGVGQTLCPSDVARALSADWRALMPAVRAQAAALAAEGRLRVTQKGVEIDACEARGPIRVGLPGDQAASE